MRLDTARVSRSSCCCVLLHAAAAATGTPVSPFRLPRTPSPLLSHSSCFLRIPFLLVLLRCCWCSSCTAGALLLLVLCCCCCGTNAASVLIHSLARSRLLARALARSHAPLRLFVPHPAPTHPPTARPFFRVHPGYYDASGVPDASPLRRYTPNSSAWRLPDTVSFYDPPPHVGFKRGISKSSIIMQMQQLSIFM